MNRIFAAMLLLPLAACGKQEDLRPAAGKSLPQRPAMARETPTPEELLEPGPVARPSRNIEQVRRSRERRDDPFDLPPSD